MIERRTLLTGCLLLLGGAALAPAAESREALVAAVKAREIAFAKTMADRDHAAFGTFVAEDAVFMGQTPFHGRKAVVEGWKPFFEGPAPFSWSPDRVEVTLSGTLAISSGPVFDPAGNRVSTFNSTWRLDKDGVWRVVLDIGCLPCR
ncbi:MAG TPA: nuclear transport factor 2 family protein [Vicinamibacteria bacterium]|nr:nuclear transport factor 2 family protein [Vicinamibacteria bacterium]